jgi:hypothetical protein
MARNEVATPPPETRIIDLFEELYSNDVYLVHRRGNHYDGGPTGVGFNGAHMASLNPISVGGGATLAAILLGGEAWWTVTSAGVAIAGRQGFNLIPFGRDRSLDPVSYNRPVRWGAECVMQRTAAIVAGTVFGWGFRRVNGALSSNSAPSQGIAVESNTGIAGGNWLLSRRLTDGGALVNTDLGIPGTTRVFVQMLYDDVFPPRLQVLVNGVSVYDQSGLANVPVLTDGTSQALFSGFFSGDGVLAGVGQVDRIKYQRWFASELNPAAFA